MPDKFIVAAFAEAALFVAGIVLAWRLFFSPIARTRASQQVWPLAHWDIPGYVFALSIVRLMAITFAVQLLVTSLLKKYAPELDTTSGPGLLFVGFSLQIGLLLGAGVSWLLLKGNRFQARLNAASSQTPPPPAPLKLSRIPLAALATFLIMVALIAPIALLWPLLLESLGFPPSPQEVVELFANAESRVEIVSIMTFAIVIAPITEELIFRMGIFRYVRGRIPRIAAFVLPALMFAAAHKSVVAGLPLFVFGLIQSVAYERTGRIAVPMIAHGLFNLHTSVFILTGADPYSALNGLLWR